MKVSKNNKLFSKLSPLTIAMLVVLILYSLTLLGLLFWGLMTAFKSNNMIFGYVPNTPSTYKFPKKLEWNFTEVFKQFVLEGVPKANGKGSRSVDMLHMYLYSFGYALGCAVTSTVVQSVTAYLCARFKYKYSNLIVAVVIVVMIIPTIGSLPSEIEIATKLGLINRIWGLWIMKANFLGMYFLIFYGAFKSLPMTYTEAAKVDGANNFYIMVKIVFPLIMKVFLTVLLINFITFWKDYQTPLVFMNSYPTIAYGLYSAINMSNTKGMANTPFKMAASVMALLPILILFLVFQKRLLGSLTIGGIKG